eukprot:TRINITY_DN31671_c0_g1_i2.p1 TRINITY_DN31671_c0_g1~~TRINITY_DN31671_c0_g1_i2.p1  ORF type:complete len:496 (+),score=115.06 TRINITY_DN31671_c0_g1_i2:873-2360(+)
MCYTGREPPPPPEPKPRTKRKRRVRRRAQQGGASGSGAGGAARASGAAEANAEAVPPDLAFLSPQRSVAAALPPAAARGPLSRGNIVRVITDKPKFGWGRVKRGAIGVVHSVVDDGSKIRVDFIAQRQWTARAGELERVALLRVGDRVRLKTPQEEDGDVPADEGTVTAVTGEGRAGWVRVSWDSGKSALHRWGHQGEFDIAVVATAADELGGEDIPQDEDELQELRYRHAADVAAARAQVCANEDTPECGNRCGAFEAGLVCGCKQGRCCSQAGWCHDCDKDDDAKHSWRPACGSAEQEGELDAAQALAAAVRALSAARAARGSGRGAGGGGGADGPGGSAGEGGAAGSGAEAAAEQPVGGAAGAAEEGAEGGGTGQPASQGQLPGSPCANEDHLQCRSRCGAVTLHEGKQLEFGTAAPPGSTTVMCFCKVGRCCSDAGWCGDCPRKDASPFSWRKECPPGTAPAPSGYGSAEAAAEALAEAAAEAAVDRVEVD